MYNFYPISQTTVDQQIEFHTLECMNQELPAKMVPDLLTVHTPEYRPGLIHMF